MAHSPKPPATAKKAPPTEVDAAPPRVQGAPDLPPAIAKQYGLHGHAADETLPVSELSSKTEAVIRDPATEAAVDDIAAQDSDALLAAEDAARSSDADMPVKRGFWRAIGQFFVAWWRNKWARAITILIIAIALTGVVAVPTARYYVLNAAGVRSSASVVALDATTRMPLKNVTVTVAGKTAKTNVDGVATLHDLELGPTSLQIKRVAFAPYDLRVTIGWGSNPLGKYEMRATGVQYTLFVTDYLSGKPVADVEAVSDEANALSDKEGKIVITVEDTEQTTLEATVSKSQYRAEALTLHAESQEPARVALVSDKKHVFVERQNGRYETYAVDLDGKNKKILLPATGNETSNISLAVDAEGKQVAVVSTRDGQKDTDGYLLPALTLVDIATGRAQVIDHGAQVQLVGWMDQRIIYRRGTAGASAANAQRYRIMSYNTETSGKLQLTSANQFTASRIAGGYVYYAASSSDPKAIMGLFRIKPDGSNKERVFDQEIWTTYRNSFDTVLLQTPNEWFSYAFSSKSAGRTTAPSVFGVRTYLNHPNDKQSLWVDDTGGITSLMVHDIQKATDKKITEQEGITSQVRWINDKTAVYRVATNNETADYAVHTGGGKPRKITDAAVSYGTLLE